MTIKILKWLQFCERNSRTINPESCVQTCSFQFRGKMFQINNTTPWDTEPYLGCEINRESVQQLIDWLQECLNDKRCDYCWGIELPSEMDFSGEIKCKKCGEFYR